MIKFFKYIFIVICLACGFAASAQTTTGSPYSQYGLGDLKGALLPQNRAMGGIAVGIRTIGPVYSNINIANPASYSAIGSTTFDIGLSSGINQLSKSAISTSNFTATLSHLLFGVPVNKRSGLSFGITPYSDLGYQYKIATTVDTNAVNHIYGGNGGLSKGYVGYGYSIGKHLSLGLNMGYLFGKLSNTRSTEFPNNITAIQSRTETSNSIGGLTFDYGLQYYTELTSKVRFILGYSATLGNKVNSSVDVLTTHYHKNFDIEEESSPVDTIFNNEGTRTKITLPMTNTIGFSLQGSNQWIVGADFSLTNWADYREGNTNPNLRNSSSIVVGGQYTPNFTAVSHYLKFVDYRLGFKYDKTYMNINNTDIHQVALTAGLGLPLRANRNTIYKINFAAEVGQRGTLNNNLVRERYINFYLGFLLNDRWFIRNKID